MFNGVVTTLGRSAVLGSLRQIFEIARLFSSAVFPQVDISCGSLLRNFLQLRDSGKSERTSAATFRPLDSGQAPFDGFRRKRPTSSCLGVFGARALVAEALSALRRRVSSPWSRSRVSRWSRALHMARGLSIQGGVTAVCPCLCCSEWIPVLGFLNFVHCRTDALGRIGGQRLRAQRRGRAVCRGRRLGCCHASGSRPLRLSALQRRHYCLWQDCSACG